MTINNALTTRQALDRLTAAVTVAAAVDPNDPESELIGEGLRIALDDAREALSVGDPRPKSHDELMVGDYVAFSTARFDTIRTLDELYRHGPDCIEYVEILSIHHPGAEVRWWLKGQPLRTDRTYVVRGPE